MIIDFDYRELMMIKDAIEFHKANTWNRLAKRIVKGTTFEEVKTLRKEFDEQTNPWTEEGKCNTVLNKIQEMQDKIAKMMEGEDE